MKSQSSEGRAWRKKSINRYTIERVSSPEQLPVLKESWEALTSRVPGCSFFMTWGWHTTWWENFHDGNKLWLLVARDQRGLVAGIAPLMCTPRKLGPLTLRCLCFIGTGIAGPIHLDFIAEEKNLEAISAAFVEYLDAHQTDWDLLDLQSVREDAPVRDQISEAAGNSLERAPLACSIASLPTSWQEFQDENMNRKLRKTIRYYVRRLEKDFPGQVVFQAIDNESELNRSLDFLIAQSRQNFSQGQVASCFEDEAYCQFYRDLAQAALRRGTLRFFQLMVEDRIVAVQHCFQYQGIYYGYQTAYDPSWQKYSPGQQLLAHVFGEAIDEQAREVNMSHGENDYKEKWATGARYDYQLLYVRKKLARLWLLGIQSLDQGLNSFRAVVPLKARIQIGILIFAVRKVIHEFPDWF